MKRIVIFVATTLFCILSFSALASQSLKIAVVDVAKLVQAAPQKEGMLAELKEEFADRKNEIVKLRTQLQKQEGKIKRDAAILSPTELNALEKNILDRRRNLKRVETNFREDAAIKENEKIQVLLQQVGDVVDELAKKEQYDLVIRREAAPFYVSDRADLTEKVLTQLKLKSKKLEL